MREQMIGSMRRIAMWPSCVLVVALILTGSGSCQASARFPETWKRALSRNLLDIGETGPQQSKSQNLAAGGQGVAQPLLESAAAGALDTREARQIAGISSSAQVSIQSSTDSYAQPETISVLEARVVRAPASEHPKVTLLASNGNSKPSKCDPVHISWVAELRLGLQVNFTGDATEDYSQLMRALQLSSSSLCRLMFVYGSDPTLINFCVQHLPRFDAVISNINLDLDQTPKESTCAARNLTCSTGIGCGRCNDPSSAALAGSIAALWASDDLCWHHETGGMDADFACVLEKLLEAQSQLSSTYGELETAGDLGNTFHLDMVEFYQENTVLRDWISQQGLVCSR